MGHIPRPVVIGASHVVLQDNMVDGDWFQRQEHLVRISAQKLARLQCRTSNFCQSVHLKFRFYL